MISAHYSENTHLKVVQSISYRISLTHVQLALLTGISMQHNNFFLTTAHSSQTFMRKTVAETRQEILGSVAREILSEGNSLSRISLCAKLLLRIEQSTSDDEIESYQDVLDLFY